MPAEFSKRPIPNLKRKVSALELKQAEIDQEKSTLQKQVRELKSANAVLEAKVTAQEKNRSAMRTCVGFY